MTTRNIILITLTLLLILACFFIPFYYLISAKQFTFDTNTLASIGSYISGVVAVLNLFVFVYLTILIAKHESVKSAKEIKTQKIITQTQFRQAELEKLTEELSKPFENTGGETQEYIISRITKASVYLTNFLNQKQFLFPILGNKSVLESGNRLNLIFVDMIILIEKRHDQISSSEKNEAMENLFEAFHTAQHDFVHVLQVFILNQLES